MGIARLRDTLLFGHQAWASQRTTAVNPTYTTLPSAPEAVCGSALSDYNARLQEEPIVSSDGRRKLMTTPDADSTASAGGASMAGAKVVAPLLRPAEPSIPKNAKSKNIQISPVVLDAARKVGEELLRDLLTAPCGLTQAEAEDRARTMGSNEVAQEKSQGWPVRLLKIIRNPLVILLATLSAISFASGDARAGIVMAMMVALSVGLRFWQEARADAAAAKLKAMIHVTATVIRDGTAREIPLCDLVPGDIVQLSAGDMIPGDVRVLSSKDLFVSQGSITGESFPGKVPYRKTPQVHWRSETLCQSRPLCG
jgi:magnesium-transporting ATPase (P-type)